MALDPSLKKGDIAPNFVLWGVDNQYHSLRTLKVKKEHLLFS
ncbi:MAG: hypothetical protein Q8R37_01490 [Nanoarchaeota archaeon]|nr:hypothetical protein [Nanoarchaeota archaeon]